VSLQRVIEPHYAFCSLLPIAWFLEYRDIYMLSKRMPPSAEGRPQPHGAPLELSPISPTTYRTRVPPYNYHVPCMDGTLYRSRLLRARLSSLSHDKECASGNPFACRSGSFCASLTFKPHTGCYLPIRSVQSTSVIRSTMLC
jgi:hypothetical protein